MINTLKDMLSQGQTAEGLGGSPDMTAPIAGRIKDMLNGMPAGGIKKLAGGIVSLNVKLLEALLMAFGSNTDEGKEILIAIKALSKISDKGEPVDLNSLITSLVSVLPPNMQNVAPQDVAGAISNLAGGASTAPPQTGAPQTGAPQGLSSLTGG